MNLKPFDSTIVDFLVKYPFLEPNAHACLDYLKAHQYTKHEIQTIIVWHYFSSVLSFPNSTLISSFSDYQIHELSWYLLGDSGCVHKLWQQKQDFLSATECYEALIAYSMREMTKENQKHFYSVMYFLQLLRQSAINNKLHDAIDVAHKILLPEIQRLSLLDKQSPCKLVKAKLRRLRDFARHFSRRIQKNDLASLRKKRHWFNPQRPKSYIALKKLASIYEKNPPQSHIMIGGDFRDLIFRRTLVNLSGAMLEFEHSMQKREFQSLINCMTDLFSESLDRLSSHLETLMQRFSLSLDTSQCQQVYQRMLHIETVKHQLKKKLCNIHIGEDVFLVLGQFLETIRMQIAQQECFLPRSKNAKAFTLLFNGKIGQSKSLRLFHQAISHFENQVLELKKL